MAEGMRDVDISDEDLDAALREIRTYVDITEEDLKRICSIALRHAKERLVRKVAVKDVMTEKVVAVRKYITSGSCTPLFLPASALLSF